MTSKDAKQKNKPVLKEVKTKNSLGGGNPNVVNPNNGRDLFEQAFSDSTNG